VGDTNGSGTITAADIPTTSGEVWIDGKVGIGTIAPAQKLHVSGTGTVRVQSVVTDTTASSWADFGAFANSSALLMQSHSSGRTIARYGLTLGGWTEISTWNNTGTSQGLIIGTQPAKPLIFGTNNVERVRIDSTG